jgi:ATP-dependent DNA helicase RecQ
MAEIESNSQKQHNEGVNRTREVARVTDSLTQQLNETARRFFGIEQLHGHQEQAARAMLESQDTMICVPTGAGKSLCYMLPAILLPGTCLVVAPLISLMRDQFRRCTELGIPCMLFDSLQSEEDRNQNWEELVSGRIKIMFVSPERLARPSFREKLLNLKISMIAIDEAHCISQWGFNFRPDYRKLGDYLSEISNAPKIALTATATTEIREDINRSLKLHSPRLVITPVTRDNLKIKIIRSKSVNDQLMLLAQSVASTKGSGIVYVPTRKKAEEIAGILQRDGTDASFYHAGLNPQDRLKVQDAFQSGRQRVIVATNSFGMGINKSDIRFVYHAGLPQNIEQYVQEIGRAGRDGQAANCYLFYGPRDFFVQNFLLELSFPNQDFLASVLEHTDFILKERQMVDQEWLIQQLWLTMKCERNELKSAVQLLCREGILTALRDVSAGMHGDNRAITHGQHGRSSQEFWRYYSLKRDRHTQKLRAMLNYAKQSDGHSEALQAYFEAAV